MLSRKEKICLLPLVATLILISACQNTPKESAANQADSFAVDSAALAQAEVAAPTPAVVEAASEPEPPPWQYDINQLLREADAALAEDRLTTPIEDNAFDRYNAVLILQPGNAQAIDGLEEIFNRYVLLAQDAMRGNELGKARALIERARAVIPDAPTLDSLLQELEKKQREWVAAQPPIEIDPNQKEINLNREALSRRDNAMVDQLQRLAMQVKDSEEALLIFARSDSEGRWIYQRMAEGVPGYRLRGDIRLGREPKLLLLPPIE